MNVRQFRLGNDGRPEDDADASLKRAQLVLVFGSPGRLREPSALHPLRERYPQAQVVGCSTAGEILGNEVVDDTLAVTAIEFDSTRVSTACRAVGDPGESRNIGRSLAEELIDPELRHVLVFSDGLGVNGSELAAGLAAALPEGVAATGGLAGDADRFEQTLIVDNGRAMNDAVVAVGLSGRNLDIGHGSLGGWDSFGPERLVTRSEGNVLLELDGKPALDLYKTYLGEHAEGLPATALLFPLSVRASDGSDELVRTVLSVDDERNSMTFAGDIPQGSYARLMMANFDRLIDGATGAAEQAHTGLRDHQAELALLISCVGRKLVLSQRIEEEVESVRTILGDDVPLAGFYSYGEISPLTPNARCELHNQTMTITSFSER